jgi:Right handed beta helix region
MTGNLGKYTWIALLFVAQMLPSPTSAQALVGPATDGSDDTARLQDALNTASINGQSLRIGAGTYHVRPLYIPANSSITVDAGVIVEALPGYGETDHMLNISDVQNVSITGTPGQTIFHMLKQEYSSGEYRHCLSIKGATNVTISGIQCNDSGGDGVYIGEGSQGFSANVAILNSGFDNNRRQGLSLISGKSILISNCTFTNTMGTDPAGGIDIEPNRSTNILQNIVIDSSRATGNAGGGLIVGIQRMNATSTPVSIRISSFVSERNGQSGFYAMDGQDGPTPAVGGNVDIIDSQSNLDGQYGAVAAYWDTNGASLTFRNFAVTNANGSRSTIDNAAIAVKRGGGARYPMGNVHFWDTSITDTAGNLDVYFTAYDWSHIGISQLQFLNSRQLSGAKQGSGLLNGSQAFSWDIN